MADLLSALLREMRLESAHYRRLELRAPWRIQFEQAGLRGAHVVVRGECELLLGEGPPTLLSVGDLVLLPRADSHRLTAVGDRRSPVIPSAELAAASRGGRIVAGGTGAETAILCGAFFFHAADHPALAGLPRVVHIRGGDAGAPPWLRTYVDALTAEVFDGGPGSEVVTARLSDALVARALRLHLAGVAERGWLRALCDPHLARALAAMHDDVARPWTLPALARRAGLSRATFAARFADTVGEPPMRYLLRRRMRQAMALLAEDRSTLAQVAASVGYGSEAALATAFKRHTGVTPGAYRRGAPVRTGVRNEGPA